MILLTPTLSDTGKVTEINSLLEEYAKQQDEAEKHKVELFEKSLESLEKNKDYFDILENLSVKLQRRISDIIKTLGLVEKSVLI